MKLEPIIQSEVSQKDKDHYNLSFYNFQKREETILKEKDLAPQVDHRKFHLAHMLFSEKTTNINQD